jgi:hypothetical protein
MPPPQLTKSYYSKLSEQQNKPKNNFTELIIYLDNFDKEMKDTDKLNSYIRMVTEKKYKIDNKLLEAIIVANFSMPIPTKKKPEILKIIKEKATPQEQLAIITASPYMRFRNIMNIITKLNLHKDGIINHNKYDKPRYEPDHILNLIFDKEWRKEHFKDNYEYKDYTNKKKESLNVINAGLFDFFKLKSSPELLQHAYLKTKDFINIKELQYLEYSKKCYLNKLKEIYAYKIANIIEEIYKSSHEEDTIINKINFLADMSETSSAIITCEICYEFYKIVYNYIKKYIKQHYRKYPKLSKDEYLQLLETTYRLKLDNCRNKFKIESMMSSLKSSSSSSKSSSKSPQKSKKSLKQTRIDDFFLRVQKGK